MNIRSLSSEGVLINEHISDNNIDSFCLTETWLRQDEYVSLNEFSEFLSALVLKTDTFIIVGDFNIHVEVENNSLVFLSLLV